jgi:N-acetylmuramoyl-L-alanine amidase
LALGAIDFMSDFRKEKLPVNIRWLLSTLLGVAILSGPAQATQLESWRFDRDSNQLHFTTTDGGVQPKAKLIADPIRLVIDLPGTKLGRSQVVKSLDGAIREMRIGQFTPETARIVVEMAPGYTINPRQVKFHGRTPSEWRVEIPDPYPLETMGGNSADIKLRSGHTNPTPSILEANSNRVATSSTSSESSSSNASNSTSNSELSQIESFRATGDGFFIAYEGEKRPTISRKQTSGGITFEIQGARLAGQLNGSSSTRTISVDRHGVKQVQLSQLPDSPGKVQVTLTGIEDNRNWRATVSGLGGIILLPQAGTSSIASTRDATNPNPSILQRNRDGQNRQDNNASQTTISTIRQIEFASSSSQLLIRADNPLRYSASWDRSGSFAYRIELKSARLPDGEAIEISGKDNPAILWARAEQEGPETVVLLVQPAAGVSITGLNQPSRRLLALGFALDGGNAARASLPSRGTSVPVPNPRNTSRRWNGSPNRERQVIVIDPGHGGRDPGAVGRNNLQEKGIVLDIGKQVAEILEQNGVQAVLSRYDDREINLAPRVQLAERVNADFFVSIHANAISMSRPEVNGIETYYYSTGLGLAQTLHRSMLQATGANDRGVRRARFYVLRHTSMPAVLLEVGFVTGRQDAPRLSSSSYRTRLAEAIARGILQYVRRYD